MKVGYLNIARSLKKKIGILECILTSNNYDMFGVAEIDLDCYSSPNAVEGYDVITHRNEDGLSRICVYVHPVVHHSLQIEGKIVLNDKACSSIIIHLAQCSVAFLYNGFTQNPYNQESKRLSEKDMCNNVILNVYY